MARSYKQRKRAKQQDDTRQRIVEAAVSLHQSIGGLNTTVSAIAERAGVERATVYRHFPDERTLLQACTGHYLNQNPPPDPESWLQIADPAERLRVALLEIYVYHRRTEVMSARAAIDIPQIPTLREVLAPMFAYWQQVQEILAAPWPGTATEKRSIHAVIGHAVAFLTWQSLTREQGLNDEEAVDLWMRMLACMTR